MLWVKALHLIFIVAWFSALFYLPRLFVYHSMSEDLISIERFKLMERKLYYSIMTPAGILATLFGIWLLSYNAAGYLQVGWMQMKLGLVGLTWVYHLLCGKYLKDFSQNKNSHSHVFYRFFNEIPVLFLVGIIFLVILKPTL